MNAATINASTYFVLSAIALPVIIWVALKGLNYLFN